MKQKLKVPVIKTDGMFLYFYTAITCRILLTVGENEILLGEK